jgi:hypothetical protein
VYPSPKNSTTGIATDLEMFPKVVATVESLAVLCRNSEKRRKKLLN